jgi:hypothetical protein
MLNTSNVNVRQFGKIFALHVDGEIYAQPLVVSQLPWLDGSVKNVVYVATMHNSIYAFGGRPLLFALERRQCAAVLMPAE